MDEFYNWLEQCPVKYEMVDVLEGLRVVNFVVDEEEFDDV